MENELLEKLNIIERNTLLAAKNMLTFDDVSLLTGLSKFCSKMLNRLSKFCVFYSKMLIGLSKY